MRVAEAKSQQEEQEEQEHEPHKLKGYITFSEVL